MPSGVSGTESSLLMRGPGICSQQWPSFLLHVPSMAFLCFAEPSFRNSVMCYWFKFTFFFFFFFFFFFLLLGPHPLHMEVPRLGVEWKLQLPAYTTTTAMPDVSCVCNLHHSS